jgi:hypothetical protein
MRLGKVRLRRAVLCRVADAGGGVCFVCALHSCFYATARRPAALPTTRHDSASCTGAGVPEKMSKLLNTQGKHKYADCGEGDPKNDAPLVEIPEVAKTPPRTALATAKRKEVCSISCVWLILEKACISSSLQLALSLIAHDTTPWPAQHPHTQVEKFKNPDIPFKLSHMGNTLYVPAMLDLVHAPASEYVQVIPASTRLSSPFAATQAKERHGGDKLETALGGAQGQASGSTPNPFDTMFAHERSRPVTSHDASRPQSHVRDRAEANARPSTAASGATTREAMTASKCRLPKHIACRTSPRQEEMAAMRRTLRGNDPASQAQNNSEVLRAANSFEWARETRTSKQVPAGACGSLVAPAILCSDPSPDCKHTSNTEKYLTFVLG